MICARFLLLHGNLSEVCLPDAPHVHLAVWTGSQQWTTHITSRMQTDCAVRRHTLSAVPGLPNQLL